MNIVNHQYTVNYLNVLFSEVKNSQLNFTDTDEQNEAFGYITELFNLTKTQSAILSIVFRFTVDEDLERVRTIRILSFLDMEVDDYFTILDDLKLLITRGYIRQQNEEKASNFYNSSFVINQMLLDKIFNNEIIEFDKLPGNGYNFKQFSGHMYRICRFGRVQQTPQNEIYDSIQEHEERNVHILQIQTMRAMGLSIQDRLVVYYVTHKYLNSEFEISNYNIGVDVYGKDKCAGFLAQLGNNETTLQQKEIIKPGNPKNIQFTEKGKELLDLNNVYLPGDEEIKTVHYLIKHDSIPERKLFFNQKFQRDLNEIELLLSKDNFYEYQKVMRSKGNKSEGISVLLYGPSGTGKSSIVEQLARKTQRNILQVDLSILRNKYWGESEKQIKSLFVEYQDLIEMSGNIPILLINECDAILAKRFSSSEDLFDYTEATMTNLLLEFFEMNKGIIVAITNLEQKIDSAFLRRFTLKYCVGQPDQHALEMILKSKLDFLDDSEVSRIARSQHLTGGQIENISSKCVLNKIITKSYPSVSEILDYCDEEKIKSTKWNNEK